MQDPSDGICRAPDTPGQLGRKVDLLTNHFPVSLSPAFSSAARYRISIISKQSSTEQQQQKSKGTQAAGRVPGITLDVRQQLVAELAKQQGWRPDSWRYDPSANRLFSIDQIASGTADVQVTVAGRKGKEQDTFEVSCQLHLAGLLANGTLHW